MIIERKVRNISNITQKATIFLSNELRNNNRIESKLLSKSLKIKKNLVEERNRTLTALYKNSIRDKKGKKGVGTLGLIGGGLLGRRLLRGRIPKIPRIRRAPISRVGRLGRFGRIGPLAVLGTGLDFVGRKSEGQTNLQAGLGAGGGLAGALAGGKYGAILGTAIGGPIGTVIGGIGGSIIGGLAGGRIADMFSGADKRRKFEIQRSLLATQKTLFSGALDDLDRVLDKLDLRTDDDMVPRKDDDDRPLIEKLIPKLPKDLFGKDIKEKSRVRLIGEELAKYAAITGTIFLLVPSDPTDIVTTAPLSVKLAALVKSTRLFRLLTKTKTFLKPGKDIPGISKKGLEFQAEKILNSLGTFLKKDPTSKFKITKGRNIIKGKRVLRNQQKVTFSDKLDNIMIKPKPGELKKTLELIQRLNEKANKTINPVKKRFIQKNLFKKIDLKSDNINPSNKAELEGGGSTDIALGPTNNIFIINQDNSQEQPPVIIQGGDTIVTSGSNKNTFDNATKYAEITALMTV